MVYIKKNHDKNPAKKYELGKILTFSPRYGNTSWGENLSSFKVLHFFLSLETRAKNFLSEQWLLQTDSTIFDKEKKRRFFFVQTPTPLLASQKGGGGKGLFFRYSYAR